MAKKKYVQKATTTKITAVSRCAVKIKDNYYTVEFSEERSIPDIEDIDIDTERSILWDDVNAVVDQQINDILDTFR